MLGEKEGGHCNSLSERQWWPGRGVLQHRGKDEVGLYQVPGPPGLTAGGDGGGVVVGLLTEGNFPPKFPVILKWKRSENNSSKSLVSP